MGKLGDAFRWFRKILTPGRILYEGEDDGETCSFEVESATRTITNKIGNNRCLQKLKKVASKAEDI